MRLPETNKDWHQRNVSVAGLKPIVHLLFQHSYFVDKFYVSVMRLGESGFTVFRLLHKENYWVWVTASSRLVFKNGQPDCIIATQRPIQ